MSVKPKVMKRQTQIYLLLKSAHTVEETAKERRIVTPLKCLSYKNEDEDTLKIFLEDFIKKDDIVIIKGSRGMRMERFI